MASGMLVCQKVKKTHYKDAMKGGISSEKKSLSEGEVIYHTTK